MCPAARAGDAAAGKGGPNLRTAKMSVKRKDLQRNMQKNFEKELRKVRHAMHGVASTHARDLTAVGGVRGQRGRRAGV